MTQEDKAIINEQVQLLVKVNGQLAEKIESYPELSRQISENAHRILELLMSV